MLRELFVKFGAVYPKLKLSQFLGSPDTEIITRELPSQLVQLASISPSYKVYGSCGKGNWSEIPWVGILDTEITSSTEQGYYIVFLYSANMTELNVCLAVGWTQYEKEFGIKDGRIKIEQTVSSLRSVLRSPLNDFTFERLDLGATLALGKGYESGVVCHKKYSLASLPSDAEIINDTRNIMGVYRELKGLVGHDILNLNISEEVQTDAEFEKEIVQKSDRVKTIEQAKEAIKELTGKIKQVPQEQRTRLARYIVRNRKFAELVKQAANYTCEICGMPPFRTKSGGYYAEAHHTLELAEHRIDTPDVMICVCAQCHRIITYGTAEELQQRRIARI